jgi:hypothetical protein
MGYQETLKRKRTRNALIGTGVGFITGAILYSSFDKDIRIFKNIIN